jgi:hypothetical protein
LTEIKQVATLSLTKKQEMNTVQENTSSTFNNLTSFEFNLYLLILLLLGNKQMKAS